MDAPESLEIFRAVTATDELAAAIAGLLPQLSPGLPPFDRDALERILRHDATTLLVATLQGWVAGITVLIVAPAASGRHAAIEDVVVDERARGRGIAARLVTHAVELARAAGAEKVDLTSNPRREAANRLYLRLGFVARETNVYRYDLRTPLVEG